MNPYFICWPGFLKKALTLSYDDGVRQDLRLAQIMDAHGIKGTFNINGRDYTEDRQEQKEKTRERLTREEAQALYNTPCHEVALHGYRHPFLEQLPAGNAAWEIVKDRETLEEMFGTIVRGMAYPMGTHDDDVIQTLKQCGVVYSRTTKSTFGFQLPEQWHRWHPTCHHREKEMPTLCDKFLNLEIGNRKPRLFYLWGHSYEFDESDNWYVIEDFCAKMGGRQDIWYATNMEIYEYLTAARSIVASVDGSRIHNPTATALYLGAGGKNIFLEPGQTVQL